MYLLINASTAGHIDLTVFNINEREHISYSGENRNILFFVHQFLESTGYTKDDVYGIAAVMKTGSFTATRLVTTLANTWAYAAAIPVIGISLSEANNLGALAQRLGAQATGQYIAAFYSAEPSIGGL